MSPPAQVPRLNLGCGAQLLSGWLNADLVYRRGVRYVDVRRGLPFEDAYFGVVYSSHLLEHLDRAVAVSMIAEVFRILRPGGVVRLVVPDLEQICRQYLARLDAALAHPTEAERWRVEWMRAELLDQLVRQVPGGVFRELVAAPEADDGMMVARFGDTADVIKAGMSQSAGLLPMLLRKVRVPRRTLMELLVRLRSGSLLSRDPRRTGEAHRWMYDRLSLATLLVEAGFIAPEQRTWNDSRIEGWANANPDASAVRAGARKPDSLYMEAEKPL